MLADDSKYLDWYTHAASNGLFDRAVLEYYGDDPHLFRYAVGDDEYATPMLTAGGWDESRSEPDAVLGEFNASEAAAVREYDIGAVREYVLRVAHQDGDDDPVVDDYVFNGESLTPVGVTHPSDGHPSVDFAQTDYFTLLTYDNRLTTELAHRLYDCGVSPTASRDDVRKVVDQLTLPVRDEYASTFDDVVDSLSRGARPTPNGTNATTVFNTGDGYVALFAKRSADVMVYPGWWGVIPSGGFQLVDGEPSLERHVLTEYGEELFDVDEHDGDVFNHPAVDALCDRLDGEGAHLDFTGLDVTAPRIGLDTSELLFVDDPEYYHEYVHDSLALNDESDTHRLVDIADGGELSTMLDPSVCIPSHATMAVQSLCHLRDEYGVPLGVELRRL